MASLITLALFLAATGATPLSTSHYYPADSRTPISLASFTNEHRYGLINDSYIVMFKQGTPGNVLQNHFNFLQAAHQTSPLVDGEFAVRHVYTQQPGYSGRLSPGAVEQLRELPEVESIEQDQIVRTQDFKTQKSAPWGLARISHRPKLTFGTFTKYLFEETGGEGVDVYVIDTGINVNHVEFEGRASWGKTIPLNDVDEDGNGHGSHCAGTIASRKYGVAKGANVIAVKVLGSNGSGSMSDVVAGVDFAAESALEKAAAADAELKATGKTSHKGSVANMSLGGGKSPALDRAVNAAVDSGLHFAVAAGNDNRDACNYSPAAAEKAVTVGASTLGDERAYFSNHGECVDVFGPGLNILSTYIGSTQATATLSGTSMASPHTAGLLAYLLSIYPSKSFDPALNSMVPETTLMQPLVATLSSPTYLFVHAALPRWASSFLPAPRTEMFMPPTPPKKVTPAQLKKALIALSSEGLLSDLPGKTPNLLIFNNATSA
ncbi:peptidase S8/S53 domain-containing protein [Roridomyces roridus]|uniref:Peptidase S8/S53 domain-containing protein n=1 Tax=Roridomyces roridus TaxID=1738132 RepID=A0AAD7CGD4_9AGAR|nr:peptidase S8/S53 domain-containing protein [Roridomyces roridus]